MVGSSTGYASIDVGHAGFASATAGQTGQSLYDVAVSAGKTSEVSCRGIQSRNTGQTAAGVAGKAVGGARETLVLLGVIALPTRRACSVGDRDERRRETLRAVGLRYAAFETRKAAGLASTKSQVEVKR